MMPRADDEENLVVGGVLRLQRLVNRDGTVDVLLIPKTVDEHHWNRERFGGQNLVHGPVAPEGVVIGVLENFPSEADLLESVATSDLTCRTGRQERVVFVEMPGPPFLLRLPGGFLLVDVSQVLLAESAGMEPIVADPTVDHWIHGHRHLQGRVRF